MNKRIFLYLLIVVISSTTNVLSLCRKRVPDQIRLAFAGDTGVNVGWHVETCPFTTKNPNSNPIVIFGLSPTTLTSTSINGKSSFYDMEFISGTSWFYSVELQNIIPSTVYYYQIAESDHVSA